MFLGCNKECSSRNEPALSGIATAINVSPESALSDTNLNLQKNMIFNYYGDNSYDYQYYRYICVAIKVIVFYTNLNLQLF